MSDHSVRLQRTITADRQAVYRAWLDPKIVSRWMAPGMPVTRAEIEEKVGGHYRIWHGDEGGGFDAEITELIPAERIVFRWGFVGPARREGPVYDSRLTLTFRDAPDGATTLTLVHERLEDLFAAKPDQADKVEGGWAMVLDQLADLLGASHA